MTDINILKEVLFMFIGGLITFGFAFYLVRLQSRKAKIYWEPMPSLALSKQQQLGKSWIIANDGNKSAKDIRVLIKAPERSEFLSFEVVTSVDAMAYAVEDGSSTCEKVIRIPVFTQGVDLRITSLLSNIEKDDVELSVVGEDVVGKQIEYVEKTPIWIKLLFLIGIIASVTLLLYTYVSSYNAAQERKAFIQNDSMLNLYLSSGNMDGAIQFLYDTKQITKDGYYNHYLSYQLARVYSQVGKQDEAISLLKVLKSKDLLVEDLFSVDPGFNGIKDNEEFIKILKSFDED